MESVKTSKLKAIALMFAAALAFSLALPQLAFAEERLEATIDDVTYGYQVQDGGVFIELITTGKSSVVVPQKINGMNVVRVLADNFSGSETNGPRGLGAISSLDVTQCTELTNLVCSANQLTSLKFAGLSKLTYVNCDFNSISTLDISNLPALLEISSMNNNISQLSYSGVPNLQSLEVGENNLSSIDLSGLSGLQSLSCSNNQLTSLDVSMPTQLTGLWCANNQIASLDVSKLANLQTLVCNNNKLTSLSIAGLSNLKQLNCQNNYIKNTRALEQWANTATSFSTILPQNAQAGDATNTGNTENDSTPSDAGKWIKDRRGWWYSYSDGGYATGLAQINGKTYFFNAQGWMQSGWQQPRGKATWYYFGSANDGAMKTTVWLKDGKKWYYIGADGVMVTGLKPVDDRLYYFSDSGSMVSGWKQIGANWYYFGGPNDGAMKTGWIKSGGKWYYLDGEGVMLTGLQPVNGKIYYFSSSGAMQSGWQTIEGKWYYFGGANDGAMKTSKWVGNYWLEADGVMATNAWVDSGKYYVDANGRWVKDKPKA